MGFGWIGYLLKCGGRWFYGLVDEEKRMKVRKRRSESGDGVCFIIVI